MKIEMIELTGYLRLSLNNINFFSLTATEIYQLIIGTNGSGKSSIIKELSPLPAEAANYKKDGSKVIYIIDKGSSYVLKSVMGSSPKHYFEKDGEELNPGHTITVQRDLVKQIFGITQQIHDLMTGIETFHSMSALQRREWFSRLSPVNYDYAFKLYNKIKDSHRDVSGALKRNKHRLVLEVSKAITNEEESAIKSQVDITVSELNILIAQGSSIELSVGEYENRLDDTLKHLEQCSNSLLRLKLTAPYTSPYGINPLKSNMRDEWRQLIKPSFTSIDEVIEVVNHFKGTHTAKSVLLQKYVSDYEKLEKDISILIKAGGEGISELQSKIVTLDKQINELTYSKRLGITVSDAKVAMETLVLIQTEIDTITGSIKENADRGYSLLNLKLAEEKSVSIKQQIFELTNRLNNISNKLDHSTMHKEKADIECPSCTHKWNVGYDKKLHLKLEEDKIKGEAKLELLKKELEEITLRIDDLTNYSILLKEFNSLVRQTPVLKGIWDKIISEELIYNSPRSITTLLYQFTQDLSIDVEINALSIKMKEIQDLLISTEKIEDNNLFDNQNKLVKIESEISTLTSELTELNSIISNYNKYKEQLAEAFVLGRKIDTLKQNSEACLGDILEAIRRDTVAHCIRQLQSSLASKQEILTNITVQKSLIIDLEKQVEELTLEETSLKIMLKEMSPTNGLIAEGLFGFVNAFVTQMNHVIRKIWSYPLEVLNCNLENDSNAQLDYRFPLMVNTRENIVDDVKLGSTGMREIVNLAFKMVATKYLGLTEMPLIVDEFGASFDKEHRVSANKALLTIMEQGTFSQLFMVSHYSEGYGAFSNAEICVLCSNNISVPGTYNKHIVIR